MTDFDPSQLSPSEREKIAKRARRNIGSEITLILTAGFALALITLFFFGKFTFLPLAELFHLRPTLVWGGLSVLITLFGSIVHGRLALGRIARARRQEFLIHQFEEAKRLAETKKKMKSHNDPA